MDLNVLNKDEASFAPKTETFEIICEAAPYTSVIYDTPADESFTEAHDYNAMELYQGHSYCPSGDYDNSEAEFYFSMGTENCDISANNIRAEWEGYDGEADFFEAKNVRHPIFTLRAEMKNAKIHRIAYYKRFSAFEVLACEMEYNNPLEDEETDKKLTVLFDNFAQSCRWDEQTKRKVTVITDYSRLEEAHKQGEAKSQQDIAELPSPFLFAADKKAWWKSRKVTVVAVVAILIAIMQSSFRIDNFSQNQKANDNAQAVFQAAQQWYRISREEGEPVKWSGITEPFLLNSYKIGSSAKVGESSVEDGILSVYTGESGGYAVIMHTTGMSVPQVWWAKSPADKKVAAFPNYNARKDDNIKPPVENLNDSSLEALVRDIKRKTGT